MRYIDAVGGCFLGLISLVVLDFFLPFFRVDINLEIIISISTFLFAILAGFFISRLSSRYDKVRELITAEDASLLSFYLASKIYGKKFAGEVSEIIDRYYITCYDYVVSGAYKQTLPYLLKLWKKLEEIRKYRAESTYQVLCGNLNDLEKSRKESSAIHEEKMGFGQWVILISLSIIIVGGLFIIRENSLLSKGITLLLSSTIVLVLLIIRDLNNFMLGGKPLTEESGQDVLEAIGKKRYYHEQFIKRGISRPDKLKIQNYRVGIHQPGSNKLKIKIIKK